MSNTKRKQKKVGKKSHEEVVHAKQIIILENNNKMTEKQRDSNEADVLSGIDAQALRNIVIVNEEFAKLVAPVAPEVAAVQTAVLARFATRDTKFHDAVLAEYSEVDNPEGDLTGNLDQ